MRSLFDQTSIGGIRVANRLVRSATGENLATAEGHIPGDLLDIYRSLAQGGVGLIVTSFTSVAPVDHFNEGLLRLHDDSLVPEYKALVDEVHSHGSAIIPQLALGIYQRRNGDGSYTRIPVDMMEAQDIGNIVGMFVSSAKRAYRAGFDGVQLHGCHGFVLSSFLSPDENHRSDAYGGSVEKRTAVILEIIRGIRNEVGDFPISIKISAGDLDPAEMLESCSLMVQAGLGFIEYEGYFSPQFQLLQQRLGVPFILTGGHRYKREMDRLLNHFGVDYFGLSRPLIREDHLPERWKSGDERPAECISCGLCMTTYGFRCALTEQKYGKQ